MAESFAPYNFIPFSEKKCRYHINLWRLFLHLTVLEALIPAESILRFITLQGFLLAAVTERKKTREPFVRMDEANILFQEVR